MLSKRYENTLFAVLSLWMGLHVVFYYASVLPDFDIGFSKTYIALECGVLTFALWGIVLYLFRIIKKHGNVSKKRLLYKTIVVLAYWILVWAFCYYQCAIKAVQDWNDMMNGNVG